VKVTYSEFINVLSVRQDFLEEGFDALRQCAEMIVSAALEGDRAEVQQLYANAVKLEDSLLGSHTNTQKLVQSIEDKWFKPRGLA